MPFSMEDDVTASGWIKGITLSVIASIIGGASKLAIRKSWLIEAIASRHSSSYEHYTSLSGGSDDEDELPHDQSSCESLSGSLNNAGIPSHEPEESSHPCYHENTDRNLKRSKRIAYSLRLCGMFGMTILNPLACVLAMNFASPSILAPFSGLTLVWIVLLSKTLIHEAPSRPQVIAAALVVMGEALVAAFGDHKSDDAVTLEELRDSYRDPWFISFLIAMLFWMLLLAYWITCATPLFLKRFAWGAAGGSITGLQNFLKDSLTILKARQAGTYPWYFFIMVGLAIATAFSGLLLLTACMKRYDATYSSAMFVGSFVVSASAMSVVHYKTFSNLEERYDFIMYPVGVLVLMAGIYMLVHETRESIPESESFPLSSRHPADDLSAADKSRVRHPLETD